METNEELFLKYESIATQYAGRVFNESVIGQEPDDVKQEFRIKLYEVILAYQKSKLRRQEQGLIPPTPLPIYIKSSMSNFLKDYIKKIKDEQRIVINNTFCNDYDYAKHSDNEVDIKNMKINGFDLASGLNGVAKTVFVMFLKGTEIKTIRKTFDGIVNVDDVIRRQREYLRMNREQLRLENEQEYFVTDFAEEF